MTVANFTIVGNRFCSTKKSLVIRPVTIS